jgi:hypothetical protein
MSKTVGKLIHVASIYSDEGVHTLLFLRKQDEERYRWTIEVNGHEELTDIEGPNPTEAIRLAARRYAHNTFEAMICGFRYDYEDRDEHGINALFHEMATSYGNATIDGRYQDKELNHQFFVDFAPDEALKLWHKLQSEGRM